MLEKHVSRRRDSRDRIRTLDTPWRRRVRGRPPLRQPAAGRGPIGGQPRTAAGPLSASGRLPARSALGAAPATTPTAGALSALPGAQAAGASHPPSRLLVGQWWLPARRIRRDTRRRARRARCLRAGLPQTGKTGKTPPPSRQGWPSRPGARRASRPVKSTEQPFVQMDGATCSANS